MHQAIATTAAVKEGNIITRL